MQRDRLEPVRRAAIQPRATAARRPPYSRASAARSYGPAAPNASSGVERLARPRRARPTSSSGSRRSCRPRSGRAAAARREQRRQRRIAGQRIGGRGAQPAQRRPHAAAGALTLTQHASTFSEVSLHNRSMAYIICEPCIGTKDTACVDVCPVDCIHPAEGRAGVRGGRDALYSSRRVHRLRRLRAGVPGRGDLLARRDAAQVERRSSTRTAEYYA